MQFMHCLTFLFISIGTGYSIDIEQDCLFGQDDRTYICKGIVETFPNKFYGNYHLKCVNCNIPIFTKKTFPYDNALVTFNISHSGIQIITENAFSELGNVQYIYLQDNKIRNVSRGAFYGLRQVYELHLEKNVLHSLSVGFLEGLEVNTVFLGDNLIEELPNDVFQGSLGTLVIDLPRNKITHLNVNSFNHLDGLEYLDLSQNHLCSLPLGVFKHLEALKELNLANNKLKSLNTGSFSGLKSLMKLNLSSNGINEFDATVLLPFLHLSTLDISKNSLFFLDSYSLRTNVPTLRYLSIEDNTWSCDLLKNMVQYFKSVSLGINVNIPRYNVQNIVGIACTDAMIKDKVSFDIFLQAVNEDTKKYTGYC